MFSIEEYNGQIEAKQLNHSPNVFHEALKDGGKYYHVVGDGMKYDILYKGNTEWFGDLALSYIGKVAPEYLEYDEDDPDSLDLKFLNSFSKFIMLKASEYSIAVARAILRYTDKHVYFMDKKCLWFLEQNERLHIGELPTIDDKTLYLVGVLGNGFVRGESSANKKSDIFVFHSLYLLQYMLNGKKLENIKYFEYPFDKSNGGIGSILIQTAYLYAFSKSLGLELCYNGDNIGKLKISDISKYFKLDFKKLDSTDDNTIKIDSVAYLNTAWCFYIIPCDLSTDIIQDKFYNELEEYTNAIIGNKKSLGILIRGTDYISVGFDGPRRQASVSEMIPTIREWINNDGYEVIALATEDKDVLKQMFDEFGEKVVAIAQERHSSNEFKKGQIINEFEKEIYSDNEYNEHVIDTTINYFYALYLLSKCNAFMSSGQNNGWDAVNAINGGKFEKSYKFMIYESKL